MVCCLLLEAFAVDAAFFLPTIGSPVETARLDFELADAEVVWPRVVAVGAGDGRRHVQKQCSIFSPIAFGQHVQTQLLPCLMNSNISRQILSSEYHDLNGNHIDVLDEPPTALEFSRLAHISRPVLIRGMQTPSVRLWDDEYLAATMGKAKISVAVTPNGRADAVTRAPDGKLYFVEPHVEQMSISDLFSKLSRENDDSDVYYLQSQNGNVYSSRFFEGTGDPSEFEALRADIPGEISWCSEAFGRPPDAVNLWIGSHKSVTSIHSDPYENIYTVVRGSKQFTLLPPSEGSCLQERMYPHGTWTRQGTETGLTLTPSTNASPIRWSSVIDPDIPGNLPPDAHPICITLEPGETLYLPPGWWHHVRQGANTIALNWWYDMEMRGMAWVLLSFLRGAGPVPSGNDEDD